MKWQMKISTVIRYYKQPIMQERKALGLSFIKDQLHQLAISITVE